MVAKLWRAGPGSVALKATAYEFVVNLIMAMVAGKRMQQEEVLRFKAMTEAAHAATGAANRHDFIPVLRLLDFGRTARRLAALARERHQFGQSLVDDYRRLRHPRSSASEPETPRTVIGDLLRDVALRYPTSRRRLAKRRTGR
ncbi:Cytochrome P450 81D1 [Panicum miliaceum]|uniref:Cytochrome P450 81D1 n=1 Tax=Panicum miliaceum TaxID=4540 RepID=A0A3L6SXX0_PANMI|nr:Cytochrome P450 81D1 [Panicum miliaceum]